MPMLVIMSPICNTDQQQQLASWDSARVDPRARRHQNSKSSIFSAVRNTPGRIECPAHWATAVARQSRDRLRHTPKIRDVFPNRRNIPGLLTRASVPAPSGRTTAAQEQVQAAHKTRKVTCKVVRCPPGFPSVESDEMIGQTHKLPV